MPDLITHLAFSHLLLRLSGFVKKFKIRISSGIFFYLGVFLPDLLTRPFYILIPGPVYAYTQALHTPVGSLVAICLITLLVEDRWRKSAFLGLTIGTATHFFLDAFQKQLIGNNFWLFPFSWKNCTIYPLFWAGDIIDWLPVTIGTVLLFELILFGIGKWNR